MTTWSELALAVRGCAARPAGAVHVTGRPGGLIRLRAGTVVGTWTSGTPLAVPSPDPGRSAAAMAGPLARLAMTDAVFVMAAGRIGAWRAEDDPAPDAGDARMDLEDLLAEVDRRMRRVSGPDGLLPPEETVARRVERSAPLQALALTAEERRLLGALDVRPDAPRGSTGARSVRDLAFALGRGVFAVLLDVQRLAAMGAVELEACSPVPEVEPRLLVQARSTLDGPAVAAVSAALRRHRVEMGADRASDPAPPVPAPPPVLRAVPPPTAPPEPAPPPPSTAPAHAAPAAAAAQSAGAASGTSPRSLTRRVPGAADRARRKVPWSPRRQQNQGDGQ